MGPEKSDDPEETVGAERLPLRGGVRNSNHRVLEPGPAEAIEIDRLPPRTGEKGRNKGHRVPVW